MLHQDRVNVHRFAGLAQHPHEVLQIRIEFAEPETRAFPVLLLLRCAWALPRGEGMAAGRPVPEVTVPASLGLPGAPLLPVTQVL